jgi:hypothetical protein
MNQPMLIKGIVGAALIAANLCAAMLTSVSAQIPAEPSPPPEAVAPTPHEAAPLEEEKINQFADAYLAVEEVHSKTAAELKTTTDPAAANEVRANAEAQVIQAIERTGLQLQEFNQLVELCALDPGLRKVVASKVEERRRI